MRILLPRLAEFRRKYPDIELELNLEAAFTSFNNSDAAVRYGRGRWANHASQLIHGDILSPICAPQLVKGLKLPLATAQLTRLPLARSPGGADDWKKWLKAAGDRTPIPQAFREFKNRAVVLDYMLTGNGIALVDLRFAATELASGRLVRVHPTISDGVNGVYIVHPKASHPDPRLVAFSTWLGLEAKRVDITGGGGWTSAERRFRTKRD